MEYCTMNAVTDINTRCYEGKLVPVPWQVGSQGSFLEEVTFNRGPEELEGIQAKKVGEGGREVHEKENECAKVTKHLL